MTHINYTIKFTESKKNSHLSLHEMSLIQAWKLDGNSNREIARRLNRAPQTINNAIKKGTVKQKRVIKSNNKTYTYYDEKYFALTNYQVYKSNRSSCGRRPKYIDIDEFLKWDDHKMLKDKWSPDACVGYAKENRLFPSSEIPSTKSLYNWINKSLMKTKNIDLLEKVKRRNKNSMRRTRQNKKKLGISIEERPDKIQTREEFGHWEIDTVIGKKKKTDPVLLTLVERKTRYEKLIKIHGKTPNAVDLGLKFLKDKTQLNKEIFKSITSDNGSEFSSLSELAEYVDIYFCHPYTSWERGTSECQHKLIRRFIQKGTSLEEVSKEKIYRINEWMNNLPRKIFNYKSAKEKFIKEIKKLKSI